MKKLVVEGSPHYDDDDGWGLKDAPVVIDGETELKKLWSREAGLRSTNDFDVRNLLATFIGKRIRITIEEV